MRKQRLMAAALAGVLFLSGCQSAAGGTSPSTNSSETQSQDSNSQGTDAAATGEGYQIPADWDISEPVNLKVYCIGDEGGIYADDMLENMNKILKERINATIEPVMVSWGEYQQKLPLVWTGGDNYDLTYVADWTGYTTESTKGPFYKMDELLPVYAPKTYQELLEKDIWPYCEVEGNIYMVPGITDECQSHFYVYREDLRKKYDCPEIVDLATFETYLDAIKTNEPEMFPILQEGSQNMLWWMFLYENDWGRPVDGPGGVLTYKMTEGKEVFDVTQTKEYQAFTEKMREWYEKGYWSQSVMAETTAIRDQFYAGKTAVCMDNYHGANEMYIRNSVDNPDWELGLFEIEGDTKVEGMSPTGNGMAISANSKNPERAMMFLELCHQDEAVYNSILYGIDGVTYIDNGDMTTSTPSDKDPTSLAGRNIGMGINDYKFMKGTREDWPYLKEVKEKLKAKTVIPALAGFVMNQDSISAELAALNSTCDEYKKPLEKGVVDPAAGIPELQQKLKDAGIDKVKDEVNKQLDAYWAEKK
ncbi:ABC transporter substrate-binding protein [uncultured Robinsoniella sp.]|uniref:ABC transporter substrate-binding protein n=1 Tax=uncultured Robinsoniella sp. TaxID=904190 RepID=UPI00374FB56B